MIKTSVNLPVGGGKTAMRLIVWVVVAPGVKTIVPQSSILKYYFICRFIVSIHQGISNKEAP